MEVDYGSQTFMEISSQLKALTESALEANKAHQYALTRHAERLMGELQELDKLMDAVATDDIEDDVDTEVQIPGAVKATGPCPVAEFLKPDSPFYEDASRRSQYLSDTVDHPMKAKELEALAEAVKQENLRLEAYASQRSGGINTEFDVENNTEGINWSIVAENVNKASGSTNRTADQCRIKWLGDRHPRINHGSWSPTELEKLKDLVYAQTQANEGKVNWAQVANELGTNRTPIDCMRHGVQRQRHVWNPDADKRLADAVKLYGTYNWNIVARYVSEDATASQCQVRYSRVIDPSRKRGAWADDEFARLKEAVSAYGSSWVEVAACMPGRTNEQCRERWTEHLNLASAGTVWTEEHDLVLIRAVGEIGNRWKEISARVGNGTTSQQCRTRWEKLKRLQGHQQAGAPAVGGPSTLALETQPPAPKPRGRPRKKTTPAGTEAQEETTSSAPLARSRPRPRPIGKGKGKAKVIEPDDRASTSATDSTQGLSADQQGQTTVLPAVNDATIMDAATGKKRALDETG
ncbi:snRNA-activating protein complex subunit 4, partial [Termitomyces sp. T112]